MPPWIQAWITQGLTTGLGVVNTPIFPQMPEPVPVLAVQPQTAHPIPVLTAPPQVGMPVNPQPPEVITLQQHQQQMAMAGHNQLVLTQQVTALTGQVNQFKQQSWQMLSQAQHQTLLQKSNEGFKKQLKTKDKTISELNKEIESLNQSLQGATAPVETESHTEVIPETNYEELLAEKDKEITEKKEELERLQQALKDKESKLELQSQNASKQEEKIKCLECERDEAQAAEEKAKKDVEQKDEKLTLRLSAMRTDHGKELQWYIDDTSLKQEKINELQEENDRLSQELSENQATVERLQQEAKDIEKQKESLQEQAKLSERTSELEAQQARLEEDLKNKEAELEKQKDKVKQQKTQLQARAKELKEKNKEITEQRNEADRLRQEKVDLQAEQNKKLAEQKEKHKKELAAKIEQNRQQQQKERAAEVKAINRQHEEEKKKLEKEKAAAIKRMEQQIVTPPPLPSSPPVSHEAAVMSVPSAASSDSSGSMVVNTNSASVGEVDSLSNNIEIPSTNSRSADVPVSDNDSPTKATEPLTIKDTAKVGNGNRQSLDQAAADSPVNQLLQQKVSVRSIRGLCGDGAPDMAGNIDVGDINLNPEKKPVKGNEKRKPDTSEREENDEPGNDAPEQDAPEPEAPAEDIAPATLTGIVAEGVKLALQIVLPYFFPVTIASLTAFKLGQMSSTANQTDQANSSNETDILTARTQTALVDTGCDWLEADNKLLPLCAHLLKKPDADTVLLLALLNNISVRFPDSLMYPVYALGYWTEFGSSSLKVSELLKRLEKASLAQPFVVENLYLHTLDIKDFYQEPVIRQAFILRWLLRQWQRIPDTVRGDISTVHSPQEIDRFPVLLGMMVLDSALEGKHEKLRKELEKRKVKQLVPRLLTLLLGPEHEKVAPDLETNLVVFELEKDKPSPFWGERLDVLIESGKESGLLASCSRMAIVDLKQDCFGYLVGGSIWKAKIIGALNKYITGALPVLDFSIEGDIEAEYPQISDDQRINTIRHLLSWVDLYHSDAGVFEKLRFIRAALNLAGIYNENFQVNYDQVLGSVWNLQQATRRWTDRVWSERFLKMKRTIDDKPELTFKPVWKRHDLSITSLMLVPDVPGEELPGQLEGRVKYLTLPRIGKGESYLYQWIKEKKQWGGLIYKDGKGRVKHGDRLGVFCGGIYAVGTSETELDFYFAYNKECQLRKTHFNSHLILQE